MHSGATTHHRCRFGVELTQVWSLAFGRVSTLSISPGRLQNASPLLPLLAHKPLWHGVMKLCCILCIFYLVTCSSPHVWEAQIHSAHSWTGPSVSQLCQHFWSQTPDGISLLPSLSSLQVLSLPPGRCSSHPAALLFSSSHKLGTASCCHLSPELVEDHFLQTLPRVLSFVFSAGAETFIKHKQWLWSLSPTRRWHWLPFVLCLPPASCLYSWHLASRPFLVPLVSLWTRRILP